MMKHTYIYLLLMLVLCSCAESEQKKTERMLREWKGKEIAFPANILCIAGEDSIDYRVPYADYTIFLYADSLGCIEFKKNFPQWKNMIAKLDAMQNRRISVLLFLHPSDINEIRYLLHRENFKHPVCFDVENKINRLNKFPDEVKYQTFLLDRSRTVIHVGNPVIDSEVADVYRQIFQEGGIKESI